MPNINLDISNDYERNELNKVLDKWDKNGSLKGRRVVSLDQKIFPGS